jgi:predicted nucleic acid-binding protein
VTKNDVVVDTSLVLKWILNESDSNKALALLARWTKERVVIRVPPLLIYEATNSLHQQVRSGKFTLDAARQGLTDLTLKGLVFDFSSALTLSLRAMEFAQRFNIPATYDTHYLALAEHVGCDLWTADTRMWRTVKDQLDWVHWIGDYPPPQEKEI